MTSSLRLPAARAPGGTRRHLDTPLLSVLFPLTAPTAGFAAAGRGHVPLPPGRHRALGTAVPDTIEEDEEDEVRRPHPQQRQPGLQSAMEPQPVSEDGFRRGSGKLNHKVALITGGDSGIGRAVAVGFAAEGADIAIAYLDEHEDAEETRRLVESHGRRCLLLPGDLGEESHCHAVVQRVMENFGRLDIVVNNAAEQHPQSSITDISSDQLERTFRTNVFAMFFLVKAALPHLQRGAAIINTTSVTAYRGSASLLDYSSTKGAVVSFTRTLSLQLSDRGIRVNAVAPGPIWTPLIPSTLKDVTLESFGEDTPMRRTGQPAEVAPAFIFLASQDASYISGQVIHVNGGEPVNG